VVDGPAAVVDVAEAVVVDRRVVTAEPVVVGGASPSPMTARITAPAKKTTEKSPMMRPTRLSMECPRGIGAGV
jgi:hypothetical protein